MTLSNISDPVVLILSENVYPNKDLRVILAKTT